MICPECGARIPDGARFCNECGVKLVSSAHYTNNNNDVYSSRRNDDIYSKSPYQSVPRNSSRNSGKAKRRKRKKHVFLKILIAFIAVILAVLIGFYFWFTSALKNVERTELGDTGIEAGALHDEGVKNIVLYGIDSRQNNDIGRSDAIVVLSIDKNNNKIKMTSVARDTYVEIEGHGNDKITHAWAFGKAPLAVKTLNKNLGLDVENYISVNFFGFAEIINYIGGVYIDVDKNEMAVMNKDYVPYIAALGIECQPITKTGMQLLSGGQALAYARDRYTGGDVERGNRHKEILSAMISKVKDTSVTKYPDIINKMTSCCATSLSDGDIKSICAWAVLKSPEIVTMSLPNDKCNAQGKIIHGTWYYVYDLEAAKNEIQKFVYEDITE